MSRLAMAYTINSRYPRSNVSFPYAIFFREFSQDPWDDERESEGARGALI